MSSPLDAVAYFELEDRDTLFTLAALERRNGDDGGRKLITWDLAQSLIRRVKLFEDVVFPLLRMAHVEPSVIDQAEADGNFMIVIAIQIENADDIPEHPLLPELIGRYRRRLRADALELWPAARVAGADLVEIGSLLDSAWQSDEPGHESL
jgi:hypothetical protein